MKENEFYHMLVESMRDEDFLSEIKYAREEAEQEFLKNHITVPEDLSFAKSVALMAEYQREKESLKIQRSINTSLDPSIEDSYE